MRAIVFLFLLIPIFGFSQNKSTELAFNTPYFEAVDKWVAFPDSENDGTFLYGFIYLDEQAGFTFELTGKFTIEDERYVDLGPIDSTSSIKYRIQPNWAPIAMIPLNRLSELELDQEPHWLSFYKMEDPSPSYLKNIGYYYNHVGASHLALEPLEKAYAKEPHYNGLEFELAFAYNALKDFDKALNILEKAIEHNPDDFLFYRELGYTLLNLEKYPEAEQVYRKGIKLSDDDFQKSEMAVNMAQSYFYLKDKKKFDEWAKLTRKYAEEGSRYAKAIDVFEKKWGE